MRCRSTYWRSDSAAAVVRSTRPFTTRGASCARNSPPRACWTAMAACRDLRGKERRSGCANRTSSSPTKEEDMSATATLDGIGTAQTARHSRVIDEIKQDPGYQAFWLLRVAFTVAPIAFGVDKF